MDDEDERRDPSDRTDETTELPSVADDPDRSDADDPDGWSGTDDWTDEFPADVDDDPDDENVDDDTIVAARHTGTHPPHTWTGADGGWRASLRRNPVRVVLAAIIVGALIFGGIAVAVGLFDDTGSVGASDIGERERLAEDAFTTSVPGDCLDWPAGNPGQPVGVSCEQKHRFEVAGPINTAVIPGVEFGPDAPWPGEQRFATIRDEQCPAIVNDYLEGRLDPQGRFTVGLMNPSQYQWEHGARQLRCGLQETGADGQPLQYSGKVANQNQSRVWPEGTCIGIDINTRKATGFTVDCAEPHAFQTTGIVDLSIRFGDRNSGKPWPNTKSQNDYLQSICPGQAERFAGGKPKLEATTLNVQWSVLSEPSWLAGSRKVVCYLGLPDSRGGFATLVGDPRGGVLLINGKAPVAPPQAPPGRALPTPVPLPPGVQPNPLEVPAPAG